MLKSPRLALLLPPLLAALCWQWAAQPGQAYIEAAHSFGAVVTQSSHIFLMRVESVDREKKVVVYRKLQDIKGKHPVEIIKHNLSNAGLRPTEWKTALDLVEPGKLAVMFHNGGASETCLGTWWYQAYAGGEWWNHVHGEPFLLRSYCGAPEKLVGIVGQMLEGKEVVVPCMIDNPNKEDLHNRRAKIQRLKVSLKILDYNPKRDFVGWGGEDFRRVNGMPGFTHISALGRTDPEAQAISVVDFDGDGKQDLCLVGGGRVVILQNGGEAMSEVMLPGVSGARAAVWADYNGDGKPDLLLATPLGPRLFTNIGGTLRDDSHLLPAEALCDVAAAAWLDHDGDGRPDILLATSYHGLRLYRNVGSQAPVAPAAPKLSGWYHLGPLDNTGNRGFDTPHPSEKAVDLQAEYEGKGGKKIRWQAANFPDGSVNNLRVFYDNDWASVYLYREIDAPDAGELPVSLGSDDTLSVWLNGAKILAENSMRGAAPDQNRAVLKLRPGKNHLLLKIGQGAGDWAFYFAAEKQGAPIPKGHAFEDVSARVGLGPHGIAADLKGDSLTVGDVNGDGRPDFLYGANSGILVMAGQNDKGEPIFKEAGGSGLAFAPARLSPIFGDFDADGHLDLFVPQKGGCKLFRNDGKGRFLDITAKAGALATFTGWATSAAWGDVDNDGHLDLLVGCLRGPNRFFRNKGDGTFEDATEALGLTQKIFNSQAVSLVDLNNDGYLDMIFNNEGQDSVVLLGNNVLGKRVPLTLSLASKAGLIGSRVEIADKEGRVLASRQTSGGDGRGGQQAPVARFTLEPGSYRVQVRLSSGQVLRKDITLGSDPLRDRIEEPAAQAQGK
jgi:hypothetical protein